MLYFDCIYFLNELTWHLRLNLGITHHLSDHHLFVLWYLLKQLKEYFARAHIYFGVSNFLSNVIIIKQILGLVRYMFKNIVLLKILFDFHYIQCLKAFHHFILQNFHILINIHFLQPYKLLHTISTYITPYHKLISSFIFNYWNCNVV